MRVSIKEVAKVVAAVAFVAYGQTSFGQTTDSQVFNVIVPTLVSITAPGTDTIDTTAPADQVDGAMTFTGANTWNCTCNSGAGASVTLQAQSPFVNGTDLIAADLTLAVNAGGSNPAAGWTVGTSTDNTGTASATDTASVTASSSAPGDGALDLTVVFDNAGGLYSDLVAGTYTMTVQGTISAN